jgi:HEAT repeat protein
MIFRWPRLSGWLLAMAVALAAHVGFADGRTGFLIDHLRYPPPAGQADDFKVRTSAALALGASNDDAAIQPLCSALADPSDIVRQAVAAALKRLGRASSLDCLRARAGTEGNAAVKQQIARAIESIQAGGSSDSPRANANAKYYVAISAVTNNTGRAQADVDRVVLGAIKAKLDGLGAYQIAPSSESADSARAQIAKRKLKAFYLSVLVEKFDYSDGNLRVRVKVAVFSYPGKDLRGEVPAGLTQTGVRPGDRSAEENLMGMAAGRATELFAQNFQ